MKKMIALLLVLCFALASAPALAESITSDGSPVCFDAFTLNISAGEAYRIDAEQPLDLVVFPYASLGDELSFFDVVDMEGSYIVTNEYYNSYKDAVQQTMQNQYGDYVISIRIEDKKKTTAFGKSYYIGDWAVTWKAESGENSLYGRGVFLDDRGYFINIVTSYQEKIDDMCAIMEREIVWNGEPKERASISDGDPIQFDAFTLNASAGEAYTVYTEETLAVNVYPYMSENDYDTHYYVSAMKGPYEMTVKSFNQNKEYVSQGIKTQFGESNVIYFYLDNAMEGSVFGKDYVYADAQLSLKTDAGIQSLFARIVFVADKGYTIILYSASWEKMESMFELMNKELVWN